MLCTSHDLVGERSGQWLIAREEALKIVRDAMVAAQARQAFYADRGRKSLELQVGDQVMVHREYLVTPEARNRPCDKLRPRWYGHIQSHRKNHHQRFQTGPTSSVEVPPRFQYNCINPLSAI